jgi:hypothetical protein
MGRPADPGRAGAGRRTAAAHVKRTVQSENNMFRAASKPILGTGNARRNRIYPRLETLEVRRLLSASADFNGDGYADLAISVTGEDVNGVTDAGAVNVIYGSSTGLDAAGNQIWHLDSPGLLGAPEEYGWFGWALAVGDFDADGYGDLAIGSPYADVSGQGAAGTVHTLYGSPAGLTATGSERLHQDLPRVRDIAEADDRFGSALASGDFNHDGYDDLAVGVPGEDLGALTDAGGVAVFYGGSSGIGSPGNQFYTQDSPGVPDTAGNNDEFGSALAAGDFDHDGYADLAVGVPKDDPTGVSGAGLINVLYGAGVGLSTAGSQWFYQSDAEVLDSFGSALAAGDFDHDGYTDLAVGVFGEDVGAVTDAGAVNVIYGTPAGLSPAGSQSFVQENLGGGNTSEPYDHFGDSLVAADLNGNGIDDLAVGTPDENVGAVTDAGAVYVMFGTATGLSGSVTWTQDDWAGQTSQSLDGFGWGLAAGDFNNGGVTDLAIGAPLKKVGANVNAGAVFVVSAGSASSVWTQDTPGIQGAAEAGDLFGAPMAGAGTGPASGGSPRFGAWASGLAGAGLDGAGTSMPSEPPTPGRGAESTPAFVTDESPVRATAGTVGIGLAVKDWLTGDTELRSLTPQVVATETGWADGLSAPW